MYCLSSKVKKIILSTFFSLTFLGTAFAGSEDWNGTFNVKNAQNQEETIIHTPQYIKFSFFKVGRCLTLGKGTRINGFVVSSDIELCVNQNVDKFTSELAKLGFITHKNIELGTTYE